MNISIIITTYNSAQTIEMVVNYILVNITDKDQIVIVDDGSSDDTVKKIKNIGDSKINLICSERVGRAKALNIAVQNSAGKYLFINDADDLPNKLRFLESVKYLETGYDAVFGQALVIKDINESKLNMINQELNKTNTKDLKKNDLLSKHMLFKMLNLHHSSLAIRRDKLFEIGCYDEKLEICIDLDLYYRFLVHHLKVCISKNLFIARNLGDGRFYASYPPKKYMKTLLGIRKKYRLLLKPPIYTYLYDIKIYLENSFFR